MPIDAHDNPELRGTIPRGALAAGSSNSNSHNSGGGGGEVEPKEIQEILGQLRTLLPQLQQVAERGRSS